MAKIDLNEFNMKEPANIFLISSLVFMIASSYAFYEYLYSGKKESLVILETSVQESRDTLDVINRKLSQKGKLEAQLKESEIELERLRNMFPSREEVISRLKDLHTVMVASGVEINKFSPSSLVQAKKDSLNPNDPRSYYNENYYEIEMVGGYHMLGQMFAEVASFKYPTTIFNLKASPSQDLPTQIEQMETQGWTPKSVKISFQLSTFTSRK